MFFDRLCYNGQDQIFSWGAKVRQSTIEKYLTKVLTTDRVKEFLKQNNRPDMKIPHIIVVPTCGSLVAGQTIGDKLIKLSSWLLVDEEETLSVIRHESSHALKVHSMLTGGSHGAGFTQALKTVSPRTWRKDKYWYPNPEIEDARLRIHKRSKHILNRLR